LKALKLLCRFNDILNNPKTVETVNYQEEPGLPELEAWSLSHWTAREVPSPSILFN